jgi:glycosyltransferase involved in cell wall biosynthesis
VGFSISLQSASDAVLMRVVIDGTPAATQNAGVGRYTRELLKALVRQPGDHFQIVAACSDEDARSLARSLPPGAWREVRRLPLSTRTTTIAWQRLRIPLPVDRFVHDFDVFHGPDFVLPPTRKPSVVTIHDMSFLVASEYSEPSLVGYLKTVVPRALKKASQIITVSASVAADVADAYPSVAYKIRAIPNGVTLPNIPVSDTMRAKDKPKILTVGTIEPRKNHLALLDAMPGVWAQYPDAELFVAGRIGWRSDEIVTRIYDAVRSSNVRFVESPSDSDLEFLFQSSHVFVYPSHYEGFGLPVLEAMARNIPVVASDIASLRETAGPAALFVNPGDSESLASAITSVLSDHELQARLTRAGREQVAAHSWDETARRTRRAYQAATEERTG